MVPIRIGLALFGVWGCWKFARTKQIQTVDGVRVIPPWIRGIFVIACLVAILAALFADSRH
jgi:hypothetical protein